MLIYIALFLSLLVAWFVLKPFFGASAAFSDSEMGTYERQDLVRLLESLEFDLARGLIAEADYAKQKEKALLRLKHLSS